MAADIVLSLKNICFSYDKKRQTLSDISFDVYEGDYICIVGSNGSGKSTLSKIISALIKPNSGEMRILGKVVTAANVYQLKKNIGVIFQNPDNQFIGITTEDDIAFGLENYNINHSMMKPIIHNTSQIMNISHLMTKEVFEMSGGQKQKVAITSVIALVPKIIIFDESTSMLDPKSKLAIKELMKELQTKYGKTIISITHDMEELKQSTKILCLNKGVVAKYGDLNEFVKNQSFLLDNKLDLPSNMKLIKALNDKGFKLESTLDEDKLVRDLCK